MSSSPESFLYVEKYRPKTIDECVLPERFREFFNSMVEKKQIQHLLLCGSQGTGKTTIAKALCNELNLEYMVINASMNGNIDTLRGQIQSFASTMSFHSPYKVVILDEADYLNCFDADQKITIFNKELDRWIDVDLGSVINKEIEILSFDLKTNTPIKTNAMVYQSGIKEVIEYITTDTNIIETKDCIICTADHKLIAYDGSEIEAEIAFQQGTRLKHIDDKYVQLLYKRSLGEKVVLDVTTANDNRNFVLANGVVVHNCNSTQPALRNFMEEFNDNCRFILTANFANKIIEPLKSRCAVVDFNFTKPEKQQMALDFHKRLREILEIEGIQFDNKVLAQVLVKYFPDFRRVLNELQRHTSTGILSDSIITNLNSDSMTALFGLLKDTNKWNEVRKWVADNIDNDYALIQRALYDKSKDYMKQSSLPQLVLTLSEFDDRMSRVIDREITLVALLTTIMTQCEFK